MQQLNQPKIDVKSDDFLRMLVAGEDTIRCRICLQLLFGFFFVDFWFDFSWTLSIVFTKEILSAVPKKGNNILVSSFWQGRGAKSLKLTDSGICLSEFTFGHQNLRGTMSNGYEPPKW